LKRFLQREVETRIGRALVAGEVGEGGVVRVGVEGDALSVEVGGPSEAEAAIGATAAAAG
jgi:ATP-dependent Clp protease ATP-binding subunit ClpB